MKVFKKVLADMVSPGIDTTATGDMNFTDLWQPRVKFQISWEKQTHDIFIKIGTVYLSIVLLKQISKNIFN